jgi:hypothetical protein
MAYERFLDREEQPDETALRKRIGREVLPVWDQVLSFLNAKYPAYEPELIFYNQKEGWGIRFRQEAQQLCILFPERGAFTAFLTLNSDEEQAALEKINFFNTRFREVLNRPSSLPQGRWLWVRLEDYTDFVGFRLLLDIKS